MPLLGYNVEVRNREPIACCASSFWVLSRFITITEKGRMALSEARYRIVERVGEVLENE